MREKNIDNLITCFTYWRRRILASYLCFSLPERKNIDNGLYLLEEEDTYWRCVTNLVMRGSSIRGGGGGGGGGYLLEVCHELGHARLIYQVRRVTYVDDHLCGAGARGADWMCV